MGRGVHPLPQRGHRSGSAAVQWDRFQAVLAAMPAPTRPGACRQQRRRPPGRRIAGDLIRPGIFLYGGAAGAAGAHAGGRAPGARGGGAAVGAGETVSYGATWRAPRATTVATWRWATPTAFSGPRARDAAPRRRAGSSWTARWCRSSGRVTMDMTMVDVGRRPAGAGRCGDDLWGPRLPRPAGGGGGDDRVRDAHGAGPRVPRRYGGSHESTLRVARPRPRPSGGGRARRARSRPAPKGWATRARWRRP